MLITAKDARVAKVFERAETGRIFWSCLLRHLGTTQTVQGHYFSKPQVAAGPPLAVHCQLQEMGPFYQDGANLG